MKKDGLRTMEVKPVLALSDGLELVVCEKIDNVLTMTIVSTQQPPCCPRCHQTTRLHSRYTHHCPEAGNICFRLIVQVLGLATGERLGVRVTDRLSIHTRRSTILRRIMPLTTEPVGQVPQIGIDNFSFGRGRKFGTIVVDLQTHKVLDVLPDRTADTSAAWMADHPELEIVSRDCAAREPHYSHHPKMVEGKAFPDAKNSES